MKSGLRWALILFFVFIVLPVGGFFAWAYATLNFSYSEGERSGYVQKVSRKGWICKTWEGELAMTTLPGTAPQIFNFSVRNDQVAQQLMGASGKLVTISYEQHKGVPGNCFGETEYYATAVKPVGQ